MNLRIVGTIIRKDLKAFTRDRFFFFITMIRTTTTTMMTAMTHGGVLPLFWPGCGP